MSTTLAPIVASNEDERREPFRSRYQRAYGLPQIFL